MKRYNRLLYTLALIKLALPFLLQNSSFAKIIRSPGGRSFALLLGFLPFVLDAYLHTHFLFQPGFLETFFWTMMAWSTISFVQTQQKKWQPLIIHSIVMKKTNYFIL